YVASPPFAAAHLHPNSNTCPPLQEREPRLIMLGALLFQELTMGATITTNATAVDPVIAGKGYVHPEVLVSTEWLAEHLDDPNIRIIESDEDVLLYDTGHIPGAQKVDWHLDLNDPVLRDYVSPEQFEKLLREK